MVFLLLPHMGHSTQFRAHLGYFGFFFFVIVKLLLIFKYIIAYFISSTISKHLRCKEWLFLCIFQITDDVFDEFVVMEM